MAKGHRNSGNFLGSTGSSNTGGRFTMKTAYMLKSNSQWGAAVFQSGLQLYLDASQYAGSGTAWPDASGNGRNFSFTSGPSFSAGAVPYFNMSGYGINGPASNSFGINNTSGYTIFVAFYNNSLVQNGAFKFHSSNGTGSQTRGIFSHLPWSSGDVFLDQGGCCNADQRVAVAMTGSTGSWNVIGIRCNPSTERSIWQNGTKTVSNTTAAAAINLTANAMVINNDSEYGQSWDARLSQFAVYNRALSDSEMVAVTNYLKTKVGLS